MRALWAIVAGVALGAGVAWWLAREAPEKQVEKQRRAERAAVAAGATRDLNPLALTYLNRLSDHLFVLTRHLNAAAGGDILWKPGATR